MSAPIGPYTPVVEAGPFLICSGQLGLATPPGGAGGSGSSVDPAPALVEGGAPAQLTQALENGERLLAAKGAQLTDVVKTTLFLVDMGQYPAVNDAYAAFFGDHRPARSAVGVAALPMGAAVEVELWAYRGR